MKNSFLLVLTILLFAWTGCKKNAGDSDAANNGSAGGGGNIRFGFLQGTVVSANGSTALPGVNVFVDDKGEIYLTQTNKDGKFTLKAPVGTHEVHYQAGHGQIFRSSSSHEVVEDETRQAGIQVLSQQAQLAYIAGQYDDIQTIIVDSLGYTATQLTVNDLSTLSNLTPYQAIFLNCGKSGSMDSAKYSHLRRFVEGGGSLYASDWAVNYLTGDGNFRLANPNGGDSDHDLDHAYFPHHAASPLAYKAMAPCPAGDVGGFIPDSILCSDRDGVSGWLNQCDILAQDIQNAVGSNQLNVEYNLGSWEQIKNLSTPKWEVLIRKQTTNGSNPLAVRLNYNNLNPNTGGGGGPNGNQVTICHNPNGPNPITITINQNALQAHLNHGDLIGPCGGNAGKIIYTTFHNHPGGHTTPEIKTILQHFILNL
jgi:hypothetical protein